MTFTIVDYNYSFVIANYYSDVYYNVYQGSDIIYDMLPFGIWYSESNYDNVNEQLQLQSDINKYGWLSYIDNVDYKVNNSLVKEFTFEELKTGNYIGADGSLNLLTLSMYNNPNYNNVSIDIYFANSIINSDTLPINLFNVSTKEGFNGTITIRDSESQVVVLNVQDVTTITYENILSANSEFNNEIYNVEFNFVSPDSATMIFANSNYSLGFQSGFNKGYNVSYNNLSDVINNLNSQVSTLTNNYNNLNSQYETLSTNYATLLDQYNLISQNDYTFSELFWSISAVPFGVLTSTFNVNVMGVNLALSYNRLVNIYGITMAYKEAF